jgi:hypothetical protein
MDSLGTHEALRSGYILYFRFLKHSGVLLLIIFILSGFFNIITNVASGDCEEKGTKISDNDPRLCAKDFITIFTIANKKDHDDLIASQASLNLIALLIMLAYFHYMRIDFRHIVLKEDMEDTPSDYTLRIDGLRDDNKSEWTNKDIQKFFNELFKGKDAVHVVSIVRTFKISEYVRSKVRLERYRSKLNSTKAKYESDDASRKKEIEEKMKEIEKMDEKKKEIEMKKIQISEDVDKRIKQVEDYKIDQYKAKVEKHENRIKKYQKHGLEYGSSVFVTFEYPEGKSLTPS